MTRLRPASFDPEVLDRHGFPTIDYRELVVGEEFQSDDRLIRPQDVTAYAYAVEDHDPLFFGEGPFGGPIVHPTLLANQALFLRHNHYVVPAGLHARMVFEFIAPIPLGTRARTAGRLADKYVRRDKPYMVTEYRTVDEADNTLVKGQFVQMLFSNETAPPAGTGPRPQPVPHAVDPAIASAQGRTAALIVGQKLGPVSRQLHQQQIDVYSGVKPGSIHTDPLWARAKGFRTTIAQGMMSSAYISALMTEALGTGFVVGGQMDVRFLRPVFEGDTLTASGTVAGFIATGGKTRALVDVAVHNQEGEQTLAGSASGLTGGAPNI
ncbi:MAG: acyl dehydratase [Acidimicrobiales bacterium]|jgi:acyl dehydratase